MREHRQGIACLVSDSVGSIASLPAVMDESDNGEDFLGSIGFMFDAQHVRVSKTVCFGDGIQLKLSLIGEDPGEWRLL